MGTIALLLTILVAAPTEKPSTDAEAARAVARAYFEAITRGDSDAALALVANPSEVDRVVVRGSAATAHGLRGLEDLATSQFGDRGELGIAKRHRQLLDAVETARIELNGDRAVLRAEGERPLRLRRVGRAWKVDSPADRLTGDERKALRHLLKETDVATRDLAERIRSGAVKSAQEVRDALRSLLGKDDEEGVPL